MNVSRDELEDKLREAINLEEAAEASWRNIKSDPKASLNAMIVARGDLHAAMIVRTRAVQEILLCQFRIYAGYTDSLWAKATEPPAGATQNPNAK